MPKIKITLVIKKVAGIPSQGRNLAAIGGNASGPHSPKKGKGAKYTRRQKHQGAANERRIGAA